MINKPQARIAERRCEQAGVGEALPRLLVKRLAMEMEDNPRQAHQDQDRNPSNQVPEVVPSCAASDSRRAIAQNPRRP